MARTSDVSVVIPAVARPERLRALLRALEGEDVTVVANGATGEVHAVLAEFPAVAVVRLDPNRGPAAARNAGWREAASSDYIAFTDDDCLPAPGWLDALRAHAAPDTVVQGRVTPLPAERERMHAFARSVFVEEAGPFFQTANIMYPRALLERLGGFCSDYGLAGDDTDLGWRAQELGARVRFAPDALVWHAVHDVGWRGMVADAPRFGNAVGIVRRHPGLRAHFHHRWFWKPAHERLLLALLAVRFPPAALPYLLAHRREHPSWQALVRSLPAHLAVDAAELVAFARGSVRARTLLL